MTQAFFGRDSESPATSPRPRAKLVVGDHDVSHWIVNYSFTQRVGVQNTADIDLRREIVDEIPIDYSGPVELTLHWNGQSHHAFGGLIDVAYPVGDLIKLHCRASTQLSDSAHGVFLHEGVTVPEIVFAIARTAGYDEDQLRIDRLDELREEEMEVLIPIHGIRVEEAAAIGAVELVPPSEAHWLTEKWTTDKPARQGDPERIVDSFIGSGSLMRATYIKRRLFDAEVQGLRDAALTAAWLGTRLRFTSAALPHGGTQGFNRGSSQIRPQPADLVAVRGKRSGRRWIRTPQKLELSRSTLIPICDDWGDEPNLPNALPARDRESLLTLWRSLDTSDPMSSLIALWDAIEFYAANTRMPRPFTKDEIERLREDAPSWLSNDQRERFERLMDGLNSSPLMAQLRRAVMNDQVPVTEAEFELLAKLRRLRNPAQHGRARKSPEIEDMRKAWAVVGRLLVYRSYRLQQPAS